jgi:phage terminase small subunit
MDAGKSLPLMSIDRNGTPLPSPYLGIINKAGMVMLKAGSELGFSPSTRPRMTGSPARKERTPWDEIDEPLEALPAARAN